jgi:peptide/nickel transport system substrate-binding protein
MSGAFEAALATDWAPKADDPNVWVFNLREGVTFHDGAAFTAEDVVFSLERAKQPNSDMKELLNSIVEVRAVDDYTVEMVTDGPNPILPNNLTNLFIMDKGWAEANNAVERAGLRRRRDTFAATNANGTGAYKLVSREPDVRTVLTQNEDYWGMDMFPMDVTEIVYTPIQNAATRVAALLSGEVDFIQDVPVQDLGAWPHRRSGGQDRAAEPGDLLRDEPGRRRHRGNDNVEGANPLADVRVRKAMSMAINRDAIQQVVMRGQSPAGRHDRAALRQRLDRGDGRKLHDRYRGRQGADGRGRLRRRLLDPARLPERPLHQRRGDLPGRRGHAGADRRDVNLDAKPKAQHFPLITNGETDFYMLGWGVPTYDSEYIFNFLVHTRGEERYRLVERHRLLQHRSRREDRERSPPRPIWTSATPRSPRSGRWCRMSSSTSRSTTRC